MEGYAFELKAIEREQNDSLRVQEQRREPDRRLKNLDWCNCGNCVLMPTRKECLCCKEMELLEPFITNLNLTWFVSHIDFTAVCLNRSVLRTSLAALKEFLKSGQRVDLPNQKDMPNQ